MADDIPLTTSWHPDFPDPLDEKVKFLDCELETYVSNRCPGITAQDYSIDAPAVFWIDSSHLYARLNWKQWVSVSVASPENVAAICAARYCHITSSMNNVIRDDMAPVYRIEALPHEIFFSAEEEKAAKADEAKSPAADKIEFFRCQARVVEILETVGGGTSVTPDVAIGGDCAAVAIMTDSLIVLMDILPEGRDFTFCPRTGVPPHYPLNRGDADVISLDFVDELKRLHDTLKNSGGVDAEVKLGLVANWNTLCNLQEIADEATLEELELFTYDSLAEGVKELFALYDDNESSS